MSVRLPYEGGSGGGPQSTTTNKAKAAAIGALGNFAAIVGVALGDGEISTDDVGGMVSAGVFGIITVYSVWKTRNRPLP